MGKTGYALVGGLKSARELMKAAAKLKAAGFLKPQNLADVIVENEEGMPRHPKSKVNRGAAATRP